MKPEKELIWLVKLRDSEFVVGWIKSKSGFKKDFERLVNAPMNSKEFHDWFNDLRDDGVIIIDDGRTDKTFEKFFVDKKRCDQRIKENQFNKILSDYYNRDRVI